LVWLRDGCRTGLVRDELLHGCVSSVAGTRRRLDEQPAFERPAAERVERHFRWDQTVRNVLKIYQEVVDDFGRRG